MDELPYWHGYSARATLKRVHEKKASATDMFVAYALWGFAEYEGRAVTSDEIMAMTGIKRLEVSNALRRLQVMKIVQFDPNPAHVGRGKSLLYSLVKGVSDGTESTSAPTREARPGRGDGTPPSDPGASPAG